MKLVDGKFKRALKMTLQVGLDAASVCLYLPWNLLSDMQNVVTRSFDSLSIGFKRYKL
jgi:hypothetical protein